MSSPRRTDGLLLAALLLLGVGAPCPAAADDADCRVATVGDVDVRLSDADALRALLQPPPPRDAAARLAADAATVHQARYGWLAPSTAKSRLTAWREWLRDLPDDDAVIVARVAAERARVGFAAGPCYPEPAPPVGPPAQAAARPTAPTDPSGVRVRQVWVPPGAATADVVARIAGGRADLDRIAARLRARGIVASVVDLGRVAPYRLDDAFAAVVATLEPGQVSPVFATRFGLHVVRVGEP